MRYAPPGLCLNDFAVIGDGPYYLLHLQGPWTDPFDATRMETSYGRARSTDLVAWEPMGPGFGVGRPGRFDDHAVWTMHPFRHGGGMAMAYTGIHRDPYPQQSIGMAFSDRADGTGWWRAGDEPVRPDPRWYRRGPQEAWRDPWVVADPMPGVEFAMAVAARTAVDPLPQAGCVGLAYSSDLQSWAVQPPLRTPKDVEELECPVVERLPGGGWLLLGSVNPRHEIRAWVADSLDEDWMPLGPIGPPGPYAPRLVTGPDGAHLLLHTVQRRVGMRDDGELCRGMLAQPKLIDLADGRVRLRWWPELDGYFGHISDPESTVRDAVFTCAIDRDRQTLTIRDDGAEAVQITIDGTSVGATTRGGRPLHQARLATPPTRLRVLAVGEFIEVYADDILCLSTVSYGSGTGRCRVSGSGDLTVRPLRPDPSGRDDASTVWPGPLADVHP